MASRFHELQERLLRAGVAPRHVRRYMRELNDHLMDLSAEEQRAGQSREIAEAAALQRLGSEDELLQAMLAKPELRAWSTRAPWLAFGILPLALMLGLYAVACFILWSGWRIFLPAANSPFGSGNGSLFTLENIYFQAGRFIYFSAPLLIGWGIGLIAARQRLKLAWPAAGLAMIAWMGATARIQANRTLVVRGLGHIRLSFVAGTSPSVLLANFFHAAIFFALGVLPYAAWRWYKRPAAEA